MQIYVEIDGEGREVLCDLEYDNELVAVNTLDQWRVDAFLSYGPADKLTALGEQKLAAIAEHRQERKDFIRECERDDRIFNASNRQT